MFFIFIQIRFLVDGFMIDLVYRNYEKATLRHPTSRRSQLQTEHSLRAKKSVYVLVMR